MTTWAAAAGLALATLASEDLTAIGAGLLAAAGKVGYLTSLLAVGAGIYVGDLGLFVAGRLARRIAFVQGLIARRFSVEELAVAAQGLEQRLPMAILGSRFVPGSRLPMYLAAGLFTRRSAPFCAWTLVAVATWTPLLFATTAWLGESFSNSVRDYVSWTPMFGLVVAVVALSRLLSIGRRHVTARP